MTESRRSIDVMREVSGVCLVIGVTMYPLREVEAPLVEDCLVHRAEGRASWGGFLITTIVEASVPPITPPIYEHGEA
jgi:hypothetical protein